MTEWEIEREKEREAFKKWWNSEEYHTPSLGDYVWAFAIALIAVSFLLFGVFL
jgi:hypothetical protein